LRYLPEAALENLETVEILLVEDSDADAQLIMRALSKGNVINRIVRVRDGVEGLDFVNRTGQFKDRQGGNPKLILLDLKMPRMDGIEVLRRLKADAATKVIPVVMLTSSAEERDVVETYNLGVNSYLVKPVDFAAFSSVVAQAGLYWAVMNRIPR
jgi:two-component system, response regulator